METYNGHVKTPADAIILFEACRIGLLPRVQRRLSEKERQSIKSGSVFVWDEREAGMRRWTDGKSWSASRVSGSFLTYREMEGKRGGNGYATTPQPQKKPSPKVDTENGDSGEEGPDGYRYKPDGLMKQSFSITTSSGQHLHLISYYARSSPTSNNLMQPSTDPNLRHIRPPKNMYPESTVNETTNIPAVTRAPMASPHYQSGSPQPMVGSPYARPPPLGTAYIPHGAAWPPTPSATPPAGAYAVYYPYPPPGHTPMFVHPHHPHAYPAAPPGLSGAHMGPSPHQLANGHAAHQPYSYNPGPPRAPSASYAAPQQSHPAYPQFPPQNEPGPQLAQLGPHVSNGEQRHDSFRTTSNERQPPSLLSIPTTSSGGSASPAARSGPATSLSSILNNAPTGPGEQSNRQGSKSPANGASSGYSLNAINGSTAPLRAANQAINALNSAALST